MRTRKPARAALYQSAHYLALLASIGANVRRLRESRGWTQEELAYRASEMTPPMLRTIEAGTVNVTALSISRLAEGLGVDAAELPRPAVASPKRKPGRPRKVADT